MSNAPAGIEVRCEVRPPWPFRLPRGGTDGVVRRRGAVLERLMHVGARPVVVRAAQPSADRVVLAASVAKAAGAPPSGEPVPPGEDERAARAAGEEAIERMRFALALDDDLRPFWDAFRDDPLVGPSLRARPHLRIQRRCEPFEVLAWAICEQLIEYSRACAIERRIVATLGRRCPRSGLRDLPDAGTLAATSPALLQSLDLSGGRARALVRAAREVDRGRVDLHGPDHERAWARLRTIPGVGRWTVDVLALHGQGRYDCVPAGDLAYLKWAGRHLQGRPGARADEDEVRELLAPYGEWAGLAGAHALRASGAGGSLRASPRSVTASRPPRLPLRRAGTRS